MLCKRVGYFFGEKQFKITFIVRRHVIKINHNAFQCSSLFGYIHIYTHIHDIIQVVIWFSINTKQKISRFKNKWKQKILNYYIYNRLYDRAHFQYFLKSKILEWLYIERCKKKTFNKTSFYRKPSKNNRKVTSTFDRPGDQWFWTD